MKKLLLFFSMVALTITGCQKYDDGKLWNSVNGLEDRVSKLERLCGEMNTNISALQTIVNALQTNDYVTGVTPIMQGGKEVGYTITFTKSSPITIYHGKDGKNGTDGKDGQNGQDGKDGITPVIGVRQDADGIYYWTLNGEWIQDAAGNKIKAQGIDGKNGTDGKDGATGSDGKDGAAGTDGKDGQDGTDGITPQLKIENDYWYISYDNGNTWSQLGRATGATGATGDKGDKGDQGNKGDKGEQGDSMFSDIDYSNVDCVVFTLSNGTQIKLPTWSAFETLRTMCNQMNTNISALQTMVNALQNNDYVTGVTPIMQDGREIGYTIKFSKSNSVTIYHGKDGKNGTDGKDGSTPIIGVKQDTDNIYYWTLNGEWLQDATGNKIKAQGIDGKNGTDGKDGAAGTDGKDGQDGADGITPQLKIDGGYWYVSYDNGASWTQLGKATGDKGDKGDQGDKGDAGNQGDKGDKGEQGDSMFSDVDYSNSDYVIITLADGTQIQLPTWSAFVALRTLCNQMNTNITALQTIVNALQNNDYVVGVTPLTQNGKEVGYTIRFSKSGTVVIYHGKDGQNGSDGKDGENGKDGTTPAIGVKKDSDGIYYWTLDGEWLKDASDNKIKAQGIDGKNGTDGKDGAAGSDGKDGANGITPQLKIDGGYWYISYDNGTSWTKLGQATGDKGDKGDQGDKGDKGDAGLVGDSMFTDVDYSNGEYVIFTLSNGTQIQLPTWSAFVSLRVLCNQLNTNIASLQTIVNALQNNDYVTSVVPVTRNGKEVGYTITFSKSNAITIYHGKDGQNGQDGKDGQNGTTPVIGVNQDTDGVYYWTLNGEWLKDDAGNKIKAQGIDGKNGADGKDGAAGSDGKDGTDGITPQLKIDGGYWCISYDNGASWSRLGQATGDKGDKGDKGEQGDSMFSDIDYTNADCVIFTLSNGTQIKLPTWSAFESLRTLCNQMNTNISSLQAVVDALQNNDYVKSVVPVMQDGKEVGYTITFSKSNPVTIYHGKNGSNGKDGADGATPIIGVQKDTDNIYYWTLDGEWLKDANGNNIKAQGIDGKDGQDGASGSDGKDGTDGITPQLKIDGGYWYISYDNGSFWSKLGQATGDKGDKGDQGSKGDSMFESVTQDANNVYLKLTDGTTIALPKYKGLTVEFSQRSDISIRLGKSVTVTYKINDGGTNPEIEVMTYDGWTADVVKTDSATGSITFACPAEATATKKAVVFVSDSNGRTTMTTLTFAYAYPVIYYTSTDGNIITPSISEVVSNVYQDGQGILTIKDEDYVGDMTMFKGKTTLQSVVIPTCVTSIGESAFNGCTGLVNITIPDTAISIGEYAFSGCTGLVSIIIPNGVKTIGDDAFEQCINLTSITIPDSVVSIGVGVFSNCSSLTNIEIPNSVTSIGTHAFMYSGLINVNIPNGVTAINYATFLNCTNLTSIIMPNSIKKIGKYAFEKTIQLSSITIGSEVAEIEQEAFLNCTNLKEVYCKSITPPILGTHVFTYRKSSYGTYYNLGCKIYVPRESLDVYKSAAGWSDYASNIEGYDF